jgi:hypothetical protein
VVFFYSSLNVIRYHTTISIFFTANRPPGLKYKGNKNNKESSRSLNIANSTKIFRDILHLLEKLIVKTVFLSLHNA